jgi:hypothetical protein
MAAEDLYTFNHGLGRLQTTFIQTFHSPIAVIVRIQKVGPTKVHIVYVILKK